MISVNNVAFYNNYVSLYSLFIDSIIDMQHYSTLIIHKCKTYNHKVKQCRKIFNIVNSPYKVRMIS
jgi:hypothetical protein